MKRLDHNAIIQYLQANPNCKVQEAADALGCSTSAIYKIGRGVMGGEERKQRRVLIAAYALAHPTLSVAELAAHFDLGESAIYIALEENSVHKEWRRK